MISQDHGIKRSSDFKVSYHSAKIDDHKNSGKGDIMVSVCHVTFEDHVIKALDDFMVRRPSR